MEYVVTDKGLEALDISSEGFGLLVEPTRKSFRYELLRAFYPGSKKPLGVVLGLARHSGQDLDVVLRDLEWLVEKGFIEEV